MADDVYLRPLTPEDVNDEYLSWFQDDTVTEFLEARNLTRDDVLAYLERGQRNKTHYMYAICDVATDSHIGNLKLGEIEWDKRISDLVCVIGNRNFWGKGLAQQAIQQGNRIAFEEYDLRKLHGGIVEGNEGSVKAYTRAGWVIEARLKGQYIVDGQPRDRIVVSCFNPKYFPALNRE